MERDTHTIPSLPENTPPFWTWVRRGGAMLVEVGWIALGVARGVGVLLFVVKAAAPWRSNASWHDAAWLSFALAGLSLGAGTFRAFQLRRCGAKLDWASFGGRAQVFVGLDEAIPVRSQRWGKTVRVVVSPDLSRSRADGVGYRGKVDALQQFLIAHEIDHWSHPWEVTVRAAALIREGIDEILGGIGGLLEVGRWLPDILEPEAPAGENLHRTGVVDPVNRSPRSDGKSPGALGTLGQLLAVVLMGVMLCVLFVAPLILLGAMAALSLMPIALLLIRPPTLGTAFIQDLLRDAELDHDAVAARVAWGAAGGNGADIRDDLTRLLTSDGTSSTLEGSHPPTEERISRVLAVLGMLHEAPCSYAIPLPGARSALGPGGNREPTDRRGAPKRESIFDPPLCGDTLDGNLRSSRCDGCGGARPPGSYRWLLGGMVLCSTHAQRIALIREVTVGVGLITVSLVVLAGSFLILLLMTVASKGLLAYILVMVGLVVLGAPAACVVIALIKLAAVQLASIFDRLTGMPLRRSGEAFALACLVFMTAGTVVMAELYVHANLEFQHDVDYRREHIDNLQEDQRIASLSRRCEAARATSNAPMLPQEKGSITARKWRRLTNTDRAEARAAFDRLERARLRQDLSAWLLLTLLHAGESDPVFVSEHIPAESGLQPSSRPHVREQMHIQDAHRAAHGSIRPPRRRADPPRPQRVYARPPAIDDDEGEDEAPAPTPAPRGSAEPPRAPVESLWPMGMVVPDTSECGRTLSRGLSCDEEPTPSWACADAVGALRERKVLDRKIEPPGARFRAWSKSLLYVVALLVVLVMLKAVLAKVHMACIHRRLERP